MAQRMTENNLHVFLEFVKAVLDGHPLGDPSMLAFRDPETFVPGILHSCLPAWELIAKCAPYVYVHFLLEVYFISPPLYPFVSLLKLSQFWVLVRGIFF